MQHAEFPMYRFVGHPGPCVSNGTGLKFKDLLFSIFSTLNEVSQRGLSMKKFFNLSSSSKKSLDSACSHGRFSKQALSKQPRLGLAYSYQGGKSQGKSNQLQPRFRNHQNQYDVLKTGEAGGFITKDQART